MGIGLLLLDGASVTRAQGKAYFAQDRLGLSSQPQTLSLLVQDLAAFQSVTLSLRYDGESMLITAADLGALVKAVRPEASLTVAAGGPGELSLRADFATSTDDTQDPSSEPDTGEARVTEGGTGADSTADGDANGSDGASPGVALPLPQGSGELFSLTLAPLKKRSEAMDLLVTELKLLGPGGEMSLEVSPLSITVDQDPDETSRQAYLDQAEALKPAGAWVGFLAGDWLPGLPPPPKAFSAEMAWLAVALGGASLAALAWLLGRRPPAVQDDGYP